MQIDIQDLEKFLPVFVPSIVTCTLSSLEAAVCGRDLTRSELDEIMDAVRGASRRYVKEVRSRMSEQGEEMTDDTFLELTEQIQLRIYENAWTLIQRATEEAARRIR